MIASARTLGFAAEAEARDKSQMLFLASLMRQGADRYILKGGMAMRALYGSARLTKDIDFDCEDSVSSQSMGTRISRALEQAARAAGLTRTSVARTKAGDRASRWRLTGTTRDGAATTWEVELSRRGVPDDAYIETQTIQPPFDYRISPFVARVYSETAMAAAKLNALLSDNRAVPRDVYDLHELAIRGSTPIPLWIDHVPRETLERKQALLLPKITLIGFDLANAELLPYLARDVRATIDAKRWDDICLSVADTVSGWFASAIPQAQSAQEMNRDADTDFDLAGR